jgi:hypothetical protein
MSRDFIRSILTTDGGGANRQAGAGAEVPASIIHLPNRIKDKVTLGGRIKGDGFDPQLLARAEARAEVLRDVFVEAADQDMERLVVAFRKAQTDPENRSCHLADVQKVAHEIKSYGSNIGYDLLTRFADSLSLFLRKANAPAEAMLEVTRVHVGALRLVLNQEITGDGGEQGATLAEGLRKAVRKYLTPDQY